MAGRGPAPKGTRSRDRDNDTVAQHEVTGKLHGKPLPKGVLPRGEEWHPQTVELWNSLRRFPTMQDEPALGWQFLIDTALMHHTMWTHQVWQFAAEIRLRLAKYGATPEDRMRLKIKVVVPPKAPPKKAAAGTVTRIDSRRSRSTKK